MGELNVVFLSIGTNLGDKEENLKQCLMHLREAEILVEKVSSICYSTPHGFESEHDFLNLCVKIKTVHPPLLLLDLVKNIELKMGRKEPSLNGFYQDRIIDIDIIFYNNLSLQDDRLTLPHPHWNLRPFVYLPLLELV
jgi:2-amino-4-hydroxy-6-hydroxymethyldihydropteridine diphosphokinase